MHAPARAALHSTQRPAFAPAPKHTGVAPAQSVAIVTSHGLHTRVEGLHTGAFGSRQSAFERHPTHWLVAGSH